jgi:hypothetical protein
MGVAFDSRFVFFRRGALGAFAVVSLAGCASAPEPDTGAPPGGRVLAELSLHLQPSRGLARIERVTRMEADGTPGLSPQAITDINLCQDGTPGSSDPTQCGLPAGTPTVELVTDPASLVDTYGTGPANGCPAGSFCGTVTLNSFWPRPLSNVYVQATSITDDYGVPLSGHSGTNSDTAPQSYKLGNTFGLWQHTADLATTPGVIGMAPNNSGTRQWVFANPDDADTYVELRVVASTTYTNYKLTPSSRPFIDACAGGVQLSTSLGTSTQPLPFPFTFYGSTYDGSPGKPQQVTFSKVGVVTFGSASNTVSGTNEQLPDASSGTPRPAIFAFWDQLDYGSGANRQGMCFKTIGAAPNRQFAVTWTTMNFNANVSGKDRPASMTFSATLNEGTDRIDLAYKTMTGPTTRATGGSATVGAQNEAGTVAASGSTFKAAQYASLTSWSLIPVP